MGDPMFSQLLACGLTRVRCDFKTFYLLRGILVSFQDFLRGQGLLLNLRGPRLLRDLFRDNDLFFTCCS